MPALNPLPTTLLALGFAVLITPCHTAQAQTTPAVPTPAEVRAAAASGSSAPHQEEAIKLDPFVIREDDNVGYSAASTLAGTRLNTALRDVGASISIITPEFLSDTAATNIGELLSLTTGTEVGSVFGNFAGGDLGGTRPDQSEGRENPQREITSTGEFHRVSPEGCLPGARPFPTARLSCVQVPYAKSATGAKQTKLATLGCGWL